MNHPPEIFFSYNSIDRPTVVIVQKLLLARGCETFLDRDNLVPGLPWPQALEQALRSVRAVAVFIGAQLGGWQRRELAFALDLQVSEEKLRSQFSGYPGRLLLVADQFEELFTLTSQGDRRVFTRLLVDALGRAPFTFLLTLRADFYSQAIGFDREISDRFTTAQVNIGALTELELEQAIKRPAELVGLKFEPGLVERILADVGTEPNKGVCWLANRLMGGVSDEDTFWVVVISTDHYPFFSLGLDNGSRCEEIRNPLPLSKARLLTQEVKFEPFQHFINGN